MKLTALLTARIEKDWRIIPDTGGVGFESREYDHVTVYVHDDGGFEMLDVRNTSGRTVAPFEIMAATGRLLSMLGTGRKA